MKTQITIKNEETCITITVEHDEPMTLSTELEQVEEKANSAKEVIESANSLMQEIKNFNVKRKLDQNLDTSSENLDNSSENQDTSSENQDTSSENLDTNNTDTERSRSDREEPPRCKWCGMTFEPKNKNEKYCCEICRHEAKKDRDRIQKRMKYSNDSEINGGRKYEGKTCTRCGRFYIPTGPRQQFCKPDCKPLTPEEQTELDQVLAEVRQNQKSVKI